MKLTCGCQPRQWLLPALRKKRRTEVDPQF